MTTIKAQEVSANFKIAIVTSQFNTDITEELHNGVIARLTELGFTDEHITSVWVPGAVEIPVTAQHLAKTGGFEAIICLGAVIKGETGHYEYVCEQVSQGCQQVALENTIPVIFGVLTTYNKQQALDRIGKKLHMGREAAQSAVDMVSVLLQIE